ncbi:hypothetical protein Trydic_g13327 [Trypoxylus dichotomus]
MNIPLLEAEETDFPTADTVLINYGNESKVAYHSNESILSTTVQMFIPFLLAGFGMVAASLLLDVVQHWAVYQDVSEVYILVPALLGLKGNLEMTLASRLSTHANLGHLDTKEQQISLIFASVAAVIFGWVPSGTINWQNSLLLCASSVGTAFTASLFLGVVMVAVILCSKYCHINPDNVATPIAASLGDLTTLALLSWIASALYTNCVNLPWLSVVLVLVALILAPIMGWLATRNKYSKEALDSGWSPVLIAMLISSVGGVILDYTVSQYKGIAVFQLVINGIGGNLVAVQASRISTELHSKFVLGMLPTNMKVCLNPCATFCQNKETTHATTARMLMLMVIPGHLIFTYTISYLKAGHTSFTPEFMAVYLSAAVLQVSILLHMAQVIVLWMWKNGIDPDNSAIPYLTAMGDLLGTFLLGVAFQFLYLIGDKDSDVGD